MNIYTNEDNVSNTTLLLKKADIQSLLTLPECIDIVENAFRLHATGKTLQSGMLHVDAAEGSFHIKAGGSNSRWIQETRKDNGLEQIRKTFFVMIYFFFKTP